MHVTHTDPYLGPARLGGSRHKKPRSATPISPHPAMLPTALQTPRSTTPISPHPATLPTALQTPGSTTPILPHPAMLRLRSKAPRSATPISPHDSDSPDPMARIDARISELCLVQTNFLARSHGAHRRQDMVSELCLVQTNFLARSHSTHRRQDQ